MPFWLAYFSGNLGDLHTLNVDKMTFKGGEILLLSRPGDDCPDLLPKIGTEVWDALNRRRAELIDRDVSGQLDGPERAELDLLERLCGAALDQAFPLPPVEIDSLIRLRDNLRAEKSERGA
jgi:hypothetical protein